MFWISIAIAIAAGVANPFQAGTNAELNKQLGHPLLAGLWVYASGFVGLLLVAVLVRQFSPGGLGRAGNVLANIPWWAWLGGVISIVSTLAGLVLAHRLGSVTFTGLTITASLVASVMLDQFGWIGFRQHSTSPVRLLGCALLVVGVWLLARF